MNQKTYSLVTGLIFLVIALLHLHRALFGWVVAFDGTEIPVWVSWVAFVVVAFLSWSGFAVYRK